MTCVGIEYLDYPTVEWVVWFENKGDEDTAIVEDLLALDLRLEKETNENFVLHRVFNTELNETTVVRGETKRVMPYSVFAMTGTLPFTTIELRPNDGIRKGTKGVIAVVGWPTLHQMTFTHHSDGHLHTTAGQFRSHFKLHPGEKVRTALVVLQFWSGDRAQAHNAWRRWMFAHNIPRDSSQPLGLQFSGSSAAQHQEMMGANEEN